MTFDFSAAFSFSVACGSGMSTSIPASFNVIMVKLLGTTLYISFILCALFVAKINSISIYKENIFLRLFHNCNFRSLSFSISVKEGACK